MKPIPILLPAIGLLLFSCTGKQDDHHGLHDHGHDHVHTAIHGGTLVQLGEHAHNLEFLLDSGEGTLGVYIFGGHAEKFVRIAQPSLKLSLSKKVGGLEALELLAVTNEVTGETVGDTAFFSVQNDNLKGVGSLSGKVFSIEIQGQTYADVPFDLSRVHEHKH
jgi:hypothetical protein